MHNLAIVVLLSAVYPSSDPGTDLTEGLLAHFPFDGSFGEDKGRYDVSTVGAPGFEPGPRGLSVSLDGASALIVQHEGELRFDVDDESYTIACFVLRRDSVEPTRVLVQDRYSANEPVSFGLAFDDDRLIGNTWYGEGTSDNITVQTGTVVFDEWRHVAVTFDHDTGEKTLYIEGTIVDTASRLLQPFEESDNDRMTIGAYLTGNGTQADWFTGRMDDLRVYARALSQDEILRLSVQFDGCRVDLNSDGKANTQDVLAFLNAWVQGCP